ncbi:hypothetical protein AB1Y20_004420 [Prymnesium parvum]|uniref:Uncharacterized protein n=1 Tax=Prymnesium parvum TaxID=97485 RepID=A0AB34IZ86_PRYPA
MRERLAGMSTGQGHCFPETHEAARWCEPVLRCGGGYIRLALPLFSAPLRRSILRMRTLTRCINPCEEPRPTLLDALDRLASSLRDELPSSVSVI